MKCHLFFECSYLSQIWNATTALINLNNVPDKWLDIIDLLKQATRGKSIWYVIRRLVLASTVRSTVFGLRRTIGSSRIREDPLKLWPILLLMKSARDSRALILKPPQILLKLRSIGDFL